MTLQWLQAEDTTDRRLMSPINVCDGCLEGFPEEWRITAGPVDAPTAGRCDVCERTREEIEAGKSCRDLGL